MCICHYWRGKEFTDVRMQQIECVIPSFTDLCNKKGNIDNYGCDYFQPRSALLMFIASFLPFMAVGGFPSFVEDMKVGKDRDPLSYAVVLVMYDSKLVEYHACRDLIFN